MSSNTTKYLNGGFLVNCLKLDDKTFNMIDCINKLIEKSGLNHISLFRLNISIIPSIVKFGVFEARHVIYFQGPIIATDIESARYLLQSPNLPRYFYMWDLDWLYKIKNESDYSQIYNSNLNIIAKNEDHAQLIKQCWKTPSHIIEDFNHDEFAKIFA
jgi:hypothetical protein